jgi:hypothetical protein
MAGCVWNHRIKGKTKINGGGQECPPSTQALELYSAEAEGVGDDADAAEAHGGGGEDGAEQDSEEGIEDAGGDGDSEGVVDEGEEKILADVAHGGLAERGRGGCRRGLL